MSNDLTSRERERFDARVEMIAQRLEEMAATVRRVDRSDMAGASGRIWHHVAWGTANLNLDDLVEHVRLYRTYEAFEAEEAQRDTTNG